MVRSGCIGATFVDAPARLRGTWFDSTPTTSSQAGVALGRAPFHRSLRPDGRPGSTPGPCTLHSGSSKNGPGRGRHACGALGLAERCATRKGSTHGCRFDPCPLYSCGRSSVVEQPSFGLWYVAVFDPRRPHSCTGSPSGKDRELITRRRFDSSPVRFRPGSPSNGGQALAYDAPEPPGTEAAVAGTGKSCSPSGGSSPPPAILCGHSSVVERRGLRYPESGVRSSVAALPWHLVK